jgi:hypothetical protein
METPPSFKDYPPIKAAYVAAALPKNSMHKHFQPKLETRLKKGFQNFNHEYLKFRDEGLPEKIKMK